jgi:GntR family transcriptional repressor for pyruvate dehydrogenase complex
VHLGEPSRLYQKIARKLLDELSAGQYQVGDRMPAERDLAKKFGISRPVVREAMLTLEVLGLIEVRVGSGAYVLRLPGDEDHPGFNVSPFELVEARMLFEGEAAALAASHIADQEINELDALVEAIQNENLRPNGKEDADRAFHMTIARATRNAAIERVVEELWTLRSTSPECALLLEKARTANIRPVVEEHTAIVEALRARNPSAARSAMRSHLSAVINHLLFAIEEKALEEAKNSVARTRQRFTSSAKI